jgi:hypothetical protein
MRELLSILARGAGATGALRTLTPYVIDEIGVAVPLIIVLFAIGFWLNRDRALQLSPAFTRSIAPH